MMSAAAAADIRECSRGDIVEHGRMLTGCYVYLSSRKCIDYMRKRTTSTGEPRLQTTRATQRSFCRTLSGITGEQNKSHVDDGVHTAENFAKFFTDKIDEVRTTTSFMPLQDMPITAKHVINNWTLITSEQIGNLIGSAFSETCQFDPAPKGFVKQNREFTAAIRR